MKTGNSYEVDECGKEILYSSDRQQVMMEWEKSYMEELVQALGIVPHESRVLEIGFGCAYSANAIQSYNPANHTIIECDPVVVSRLKQWRKDMYEQRIYGTIDIVQGTWQNVMAEVGEFDCIFFDDFPLPEITSASPQIIPPPVSRWYPFLDVATERNLTNCGRITGYLALPLDFARPGFTYTVNPTTLDIPLNCKYSPEDQNYYIPILRKQSTGESLIDLRPDVRNAMETLREKRHKLIEADEVEEDPEAPKYGWESAQTKFSTRGEFIKDLRLKAKTSKTKSQKLTS